MASQGPAGPGLGSQSGAVLLVAAIAAVVSFVHIEHLAVTQWLARFMLGFAVTATLAANVGYGPMTFS